MEKRSGKPVYNGIAIGKIAFFGKGAQTVKREKTDDPEKEVTRYNDAKEEAIRQLKEIYQKAVKEVGEDNAAIFDVHAMLLEDDDYNDSIINMIKTQQVNAEYAVAVTGDNFSEMFANMDDEYFKARSADIKDVSERVISVLTGRTSGDVLTEPSILIADDLAPSETVQLDKSKLLGFATRHGSSTSHTAILARTMNIPALIKTDIDESWDGHEGILDGNAGLLIVDPTEEVAEEYKKKKAEEEEQKKLLQNYKGYLTITPEGKKINLYANIANVSDLSQVLSNDAEGVGLFRSEFLYLESDDFPTEEQQFTAYKKAAEIMAGKKVIIRTLDIGADKQVDYFGLEKEANPAMGLRAIRICLTRPEIFETQLRALIRASAFGNISIMYPMITSVWEVKKILEIVDKIKNEFDEIGIKYGDFEQGIMIETPAAVMISDELGKYVDFFSIGTNDLTQYTLAVDRQNPNLDMFFNPHHEAVLRMIKMVIENAHRNGIWAGICGELGADTTLSKKFAEMGIDELSVSPSMILKVRKALIDPD